MTNCVSEVLCTTDRVDDRLVHTTVFQSAFLNCIYVFIIITNDLNALLELTGYDGEFYWLMSECSVFVCNA